MHWMGNWGNCFGNYGVTGGIIMFIIWIVVIIAAIWIVKELVGKRGEDKGLPSQKSALDILKERYARGEITKEQYEQMKKDII